MCPVRHGGAKNIFWARALLQRQWKEQHFWGTEASFVGLHSNEQGLEIHKKWGWKMRALQVMLKS